MQVEIWSDVVCPWCYIGKRRFEHAIKTLNEEHPDVVVNVRYRAFQLDPDAPIGVSQRVSEVYAEKFGGRDQARALMTRVTEEAAKEGIAFDLEIAQRSNTRDAHRLLVLAVALGKQEALKEALMSAYFTEGRAIGERSTLVEIAAAVGIPSPEAEAWMTSERGSKEVEADRTMAASFGITSVPTFVFNRESGIAGAHPATELLRELKRVGGLR